MRDVPHTSTAFVPHPRAFLIRVLVHDLLSLADFASSKKDLPLVVRNAKTVDVARCLQKANINVGVLRAARAAVDETAYPARTTSAVPSAASSQHCT